MLDWVNLVSGLMGGFLSTLLVHPVDLLKIRSAVNEGSAGVRPQFNGYRSTVRSILKHKSVVGLYQGIAPNLLGNTLSWGYYFLFYNYFKDLIRSSIEPEELGKRHNLAAGIMAGNITLFLTNPIWVAKTRLCLQYENEKPMYTGVMDVLRQVYRTNGLRGLYKGLLPGMIGTSHGALQFMAYDDLKKRYGSADPGPEQHVALSALSKVFAVSITYPYQVLRMRLQDQHVNHAGVLDVIRKTWRGEGVFGFYKGLLPSIFRVVPATCVTFVVFEEMTKRLR